MRIRHMVLGCLSVPLALVAVAIGALIVALVLGPPDASQTNTTLEQPVARMDTLATDPPLDSEKPLRVLVRLEEGSFEIVPAPLGEPIRIDADYMDGLFVLEPTFETDSQGEIFELTFRRKGRFSALQEFVHWRNHKNGARVSLQLPTGVPLEISVHMRKGELGLDLSGLAVRKFELDTAMCTTTLRFLEPNPTILDVLDVRAKMCEFEAIGLGHAAVRHVVIDGKMGEFRLDFDGPWTTDTDALVRASMCEMLLSVPPEIRTEFTQRSVVMADLKTDKDFGLTDPETQDQARTLLLNLSVRLGEVEIR